MQTSTSTPRGLLSLSRARLFDMGLEPLEDTALVRRGDWVKARGGSLGLFVGVSSSGIVNTVWTGRSEDFEARCRVMDETETHKARQRAVAARNDVLDPDSRTLWPETAKRAALGAVDALEGRSSNGQKTLTFFGPRGGRTTVYLYRYRRPTSAGHVYRAELAPSWRLRG